jgi:hypothetical protein
VLQQHQRGTKANLTHSRHSHSHATLLKHIRPQAEDDVAAPAAASAAEDAPADAPADPPAAAPAGGDADAGSEVSAGASLLLIFCVCAS